MKLRDDIRYSAILLDVDSQPISIGEVLLRQSQDYGLFWPHSPKDEDSILKNAKTLQVSGVGSLTILKIEKHQGETPIHFQMDIDFSGV
jgi:hypothetical protein